MVRVPSGIDMNSIVTTEQCEQRVQSVLKELGEDSTGHRWDEGYVLDVTTMNLSDDLVSAVKEVTACMRIQKIPSRGTRSSSRSCQAKQHVGKVTVNMNGIAKPTTWLSSAPMIPKRLIELQRSRQVRPKKLAAAIITGMTNQLKTIGWLNSTTVGISREEEATE